MLLRRSMDRGRSHLNWLKSHHTFSFAEYYDEKWMHFGCLRVINEDFILPGQGFGMHPHRDMEIITYVIHGALAHQDSMGNGSVILPGEIQRMSAGKGVKHSEFNHSKQEELHLLQIWILPERKEIEPSYEQKKIDKKVNQLTLIGSNRSTEGAVMIHQDVLLSVGFFEKECEIIHPFMHRQAWLQLIKGQIQVNQQTLLEGDGVGFQDEKQLMIHCNEDAEFLLFEMSA